MDGKYSINEDSKRNFADTQQRRTTNSKLYEEWMSKKKEDLQKECIKKDISYKSSHTKAELCYVLISSQQNFVYEDLLLYQLKEVLKCRGVEPKSLDRKELADIFKKRSLRS